MRRLRLFLIALETASILVSNFARAAGRMPWRRFPRGGRATDAAAPRSLVEHLMLDEHPYPARPPLLSSSIVGCLGVEYFAGIGVANDQLDVVVRLGRPANHTDHGLL